MKTTFEQFFKRIASLTPILCEGDKITTSEGFVFNIHYDTSGHIGEYIYVVGYIFTVSGSYIASWTCESAEESYKLARLWSHMKDKAYSSADRNQGIDRHRYKAIWESISIDN